MRKIDPASASGARSNSARSVSRTSVPAPVVGSYDFTTPCIGGARYRRAVATGDTGEFQAIERIRRLLPPAPPGETWIGDDAAVVHCSSGPLLLAADMVVEGVHFRWN